MNNYRRGVKTNEPKVVIFLERMAKVLPQFLLNEESVTPSVLPLKQLAKLCHEHHVFVIMHVIKCVDPFL